MGFEALEKVVEAIADGADDHAGRMLGRVESAYRADAEEERLAVVVFARALARRLTRAPALGNLYLSSFDVAQIDLFDLVARRLPSVAVTTRSATKLLCDLCRGRPEATLVDVGIGTGRQVRALLASLAAVPDAPRHLTVIGIDPSEESLREAGAAIRTAAHDARVSVEFIDVCAPIERVPIAAWRRVRAAGAIVNASFALHHVAEAGARDRVLREIRAIEPRAIVLTEPDVDHAEPDLRQRFRNCWRHFVATFRLVGSLDLSREEKEALCLGFFGREIDDIVGSPEEDRCERHETLATWSARLRRAGFGAPREQRFVHAGVPLTGVLCAESRS